MPLASMARASSARSRTKSLRRYPSERRRLRRYYLVSRLARWSPKTQRRKGRSSTIWNESCGHGRRLDAMLLPLPTTRTVDGPEADRPILRPIELLQLGDGGEVLLLQVGTHGHEKFFVVPQHNEVEASHEWGN